MNAAQRYQVKASVFVEFIQIWLVLEIVGDLVFLPMMVSFSIVP